MLPGRALPGGRIASLGATRDFHHGLLAVLVAIVGISFPVANAQETDPPERALVESAEVSRSTFVSHANHGWSRVLDIPMGRGRDNRLTLGLVFGSDDDLPEKYLGNRLYLKSRRVATGRVGLRLEFAHVTVYATFAWPRLWSWWQASQATTGQRDK